jgi:hypothetical protein
VVLDIRWEYSDEHQLCLDALRLHSLHSPKLELINSRPEDKAKVYRVMIYCINFFFNIFFSTFFDTLNKNKLPRPFFSHGNGYLFGIW